MCKNMIENERTIKNLLKTYGAGQLMEEAEFWESHCDDHHRQLNKRGMQIHGEGWTGKKWTCGLRVKHTPNGAWWMRAPTDISTKNIDVYRWGAARWMKMSNVVHNNAMKKNEECWQNNYDDNTLAQSVEQIHSTKQCMYTIKNWNLKWNGRALITWQRRNVTNVPIECETESKLQQI